jgi:hypothetical protein
MRKILLTLSDNVADQQIQSAIEELDIPYATLNIKPKRAKTLKDLQGELVTEVKISKSGAAHIKTMSGTSIVVTDATVKQDLAAEELLALGLVSKADLEAFKRLRSLGLS